MADEITRYLDEYELRGDELVGDYTPNSFERLLIENAMRGFEFEIHDPLKAKYLRLEKAIKAVPHHVHCKVSIAADYKKITDGVICNCWKRAALENSTNQTPPETPEPLP